jgi:hypothetical protein
MSVFIASAGSLDPIVPLDAASLSALARTLFSGIAWTCSKRGELAFRMRITVDV